MDKKQLMEYMKVVCDAENTIFECDETLAELNKQLEAKWKMPLEPRKPEYVLPQLVEPEIRKATTVSSGDVSSVQNVGGAGGCVIGFIGFVIALIIYFNGGFSTSVGMDALALLIICPACGILLTFLANGIIAGSNAAEANRQNEASRASADATNERNRRNAEEINERRQREAREENDRRDAKYNTDLALYKAQVKMRTEAKERAHAQIREAIAVTTETRKRVEAQLAKLYDKDVIHKTFRKMIAVNQLYEYLEMGLCDGLQGPTGAYAQYLEDLRTNKICDTVNELKVSMEEGIKHLLMAQNQIVTEIRSTNDRISHLGSSISASIGSLGARIDEGFGAMGSSLSSMQTELVSGRAAMKDVTAAIESGSRKTNEAVSKQLSQMQKTLNAGVHNDYIAKREQGIKDYLLKNPNFL